MENFKLNKDAKDYIKHFLTIISIAAAFCIFVGLTIDFITVDEVIVSPIQIMALIGIIIGVITAFFLIPTLIIFIIIFINHMKYYKSVKGLWGSILVNIKTEELDLTEEAIESEQERIKKHNELVFYFTKQWMIENEDKQTEWIKIQLEKYYKGEIEIEE